MINLPSTIYILEMKLRTIKTAFGNIQLEPNEIEQVYDEAYEYLMKIESGADKPSFGI